MGIPFIINSIQEKAVADYAGLSFLEVAELNIFDFWALLRDAVIYDNRQTKEGREWLHNAWRLTQTEPEVDKLRKKYGKGG